MKVSLGADEKSSLDLVLGKDPAARSPQADRLVRAGARPLMEKMAEAGMRPRPARLVTKNPTSGSAQGRSMTSETGGLRRSRRQGTLGATLCSLMPDPG
jgi:hypothetical protein